jgi:murein DD-endopeptidase MepM/ murein hydrolase activator NlpD
VARRIVLALAVAGALLATGAGTPGSQAGACDPSNPTCQQLQQAQESQSSAQQGLQQIEQSLADAQQKANQLRAYLTRIQSQVDAQLAAIDQTTAHLAETERQIRFTEADIQRQQAHLDVRRDLLAQRVRAMDKQGPLDYLQLVVTASSFGDLVDRLMIMQDVVRGDQRLIASLNQARAQVEALRQRLGAERDQVAALLRQQQDQEAKLEQTRRTQQDALAYEQVLEAQFAQQRAQLEAEKAKIDALVNQLQAQYDAEARGAGGGSGLFAWPEHGVITQLFGCTDLLGEPYDPSCPGHHFHTGLDIAASFGNPIGAGDAGVVSYVNYGWGGGYGNYILITHGNGYASLYAHLSAISVGVGQVVARGQVIGAEGSTGYSTGPHLHFEIRLNGAYQNPLSYLA